MQPLRDLDRRHAYATDKLGRGGRHDYGAAFEFHFGPYRTRPITFWEIGVDRGGSLAMWGDYFPLAQVIGIDLLPKPDGYECRPNCEWVTGDATNPDHVRALTTRYGAPDVVLDDGSHRASDMKRAFELIFPETKALYVVEDLGTQYEDLHGRAFLDAAPFTDALHGLCDALARNVGGHPTVGRVCWEPGQAYVYKK